MSKTEAQERWAGILTLIEESLGSVGFDAPTWEEIKKTVQEYESRESGPLYEAFREKFEDQGIDPVIAKQLAKIASAPDHRY